MKDKALIVITFIVCSFISSAQTGKILKFKKHQYQFIQKSGVSYEEALAAVPNGWHLVTITSAEEQAFIKAEASKLPRVTTEPDHYFIGAIYENGVWKWLTGEKWDFTVWGPNEPNNPRETCATIRLEFGENPDYFWTWNNVYPGKSQSRYFAGYIIEKDKKK